MTRTDIARLSSQTWTAIAFSAALVAVSVMLWFFLRYREVVVRVLRPSGGVADTRLRAARFRDCGPVDRRICRGIRPWCSLVRDVAGAANTAAMTADNTCRLWTTVGYRPSAQTASDGPGRCAHYYYGQKVSCQLRAR